MKINHCCAEVERGETKLWASNGNGKVAFAYPFVDGNYNAAGKRILDRKQMVPTGDFIPSLLYSAYCVEKVFNESEFREIRNDLKGNWLWVYNRYLWTFWGVYVVQDSGVVGLTENLDEKKLEEELKGGREIKGADVRVSSNGRVRFAPKGSYRLGENNHNEFARSGLLIASCNEDGAEKLGEISSKFKFRPFVKGVEIIDEGISKRTVSAIYGHGKRLNFYCDTLGNNRYSHTFGIYNNF